MKNVVLVGNPNVGKTSVFNFLTGSQFRVGNFPGVTVEKRYAKIEFEGETYQFVDLPGIYSFISRSPDEEITRDYLLEEGEDAPDIILNVVDANNLDRNLYLTTSLLQLGKPLILIVTMLDIASHNGRNIDIERLSRNLGVPVIGINHKEKVGQDRLFKKLKTPLSPPKNIVFPTILYQNVLKLSEAISKSPLIEYQSKADFIAFKILEDNKQITSLFDSDPNILDAKERTLEKLKTLFYNDMALVLVQFRYTFIESALRKVYLSPRKGKTTTQKIDRFLLHKIWGFPFFILIIWFSFKAAVSIGTAFQDFFDIAFGAIFVDFLGDLLAPFPFLKLILADSIGSGIQSLMTFVPVIFMVFVVVNLMEDTGYLARITVLVDRIMRFLSLPGKALAPLIMGFGCNVASIFGARILETPTERKISIAMSPFISCGARLPVYSLIVLALFPHNQGGIITSLYLVGIFFSIFTAFLLSRLFFRRERQSFLLLELPEYHFPDFKSIMKLSWRRVTGLMFRALKLVIVFMAIYQVLDHITLSHPKEGFLVKDDDKSLIRSFGEKLSLPLSYMGVQEKSWPLAVGLVNGLLAKEAVVGTLVVAFSAQDGGKKEEKTPFSLGQSFSKLFSSLKEAFLSIPHNLIGYRNEKGEWESGVLTSPAFYIPLYNVFNPVEEIDEEANSIVGKIQKSFLDESLKDEPIKQKRKAKIAAYAYMLFILLYTACIAVLSATNKELGPRWMWGVLIYQLLLAYGVSVLFYQLGILFL